MHNVRAQPVPFSAFAENVEPSVFLRDGRLETVFFKALADLVSDLFVGTCARLDLSGLLLCNQPLLRAPGFRFRYVTPGGREPVDRREYDVQRKHQQEKIKIPAVINIEKAETRVDQAFGWRKRCEI